MEHSDPSRPDRARALDLVEPPEFETLLLAIAGEQWEPPRPLGPGALLLAPGFEGSPLTPAASGADAGAGAGRTLELIAQSGSAGLTGLVLRPPRDSAARAAIEAAAFAAQLSLYWLPSELSWADAHQGLAEAWTRRRAQPGGRPAAADLSSPDLAELAELAQTIATLTGGLVTIEDMAARVIAYSRSGDEVDVLRRLSILGRSGPEDYLALLRTWGVYDRLAASEEVVEIAEHPESGVRRRLAVGVFAGTRQLGVIWVQQGTHEFGPHARQALIGAARITAEHLVGGASAFATRGNPRPGGLADLLSGRVADLPELAARGSRAPCAVAVVAVVDAAEAASGAIETEPSDPAARRLLLGELTSILKLHAAGFRRNALVEVVEDQVCLLLPALESAGSASAFLAAALADAQRHLPLTVRAAIGPLVAQPADARRSLLGAERALSLASAGAARSEDDRSVPITLFDSVRTRLVTEAASRAAATGQDPALPALDRLIEGQPAIARTLLSYLESGGQVAPTAVELGVHVTTVRYRLRRAAEVAELDLSDADDRLAAQLILRFAFRAREIKA